MNKEKRKKLQDANERLGKVRNEINEILGEVQAVMKEEQNAYDNMPESFQSGERGEANRTAYLSMEDCKMELDSIRESMDSAMSHLDNIE